MLDYPMAVATARPVEDARALVAELVGLPGPDDQGRFDGVRGGLRCAVGEVAHPVVAELHTELLGRPSSFGVLWLVDNKAGEASCAEARRDLALCSAALAGALGAEVCLTFGYDRVVMRRTAGELVLHSWFPEWAELESEGALPWPHRLVDEDGRLS